MKRWYFTILLLAIVPIAIAQDYRQCVDSLMRSFTQGYDVRGRFVLGKLSVNKERKTYTVELKNDYESLAFREQMVDSMERGVKQIILNGYPGYKVDIVVNKANVRTLIPNCYLPDDKQNMSKNVNNRQQPESFVRNTDRGYEITDGLQDRNIALWQSHGRYYDQRTDRWIWQRARVMTTVEDKLSLSYVIPYLMPMLERAGANVLLPRERDLQPHEVIVDNDGSDSDGGRYVENGNYKIFSTPDTKGFAHNREIYVDRQNPFADGTCRAMKCDETETAKVVWMPDIPEDGWYYVSVAYTTTKHSVPDARYTVKHSAGETHFTVNQRMGGGTWIYLGRFYFNKGCSKEKSCVMLSNKSDYRGEVTADAVRFGGGMGNIGRRPAGKDEITQYTGNFDSKNLISSYEKADYTTSGADRFWEAGRYWLQWAGAPFSVYSHTQGFNDYKDDYNCRGLWVNWLNNGSVNAPDSLGLAIPIDAALAFHTDAGCLIDTVIGTLGIYTTKGEDKSENFTNGKSRAVSRDFTDLVVSQVVDDVRRQINPDWTRRYLWNKNYNESRRPDVPTMLLELLSHQNFEDMQYGLDPRFRFIVSRAVYKAVVRFVATRNRIPYVIAPLPVNSFAIESVDGGNSLKLSWKPTADTLETTADPTGYMVYCREDGEGWSNGRYVNDTELVVPFYENRLVSYKIVAVNSGGASMDSEILSAYRAPDSKGLVMIINGFDRVAAPEGFQALPYAGFTADRDRGVGDVVEYHYVGAQHNFDTRDPWISDDSAGWGQSDSDFDLKVVAGNSHDYPFVHGRAILNAGYSYVSSSRKAVENDYIDITKYQIVDIVLGEQKRTYWGLKGVDYEFETFSPEIQRVLLNYTAGGGNLFVSGAYVVTDNWVDRGSTESDRTFVKTCLGVEWRADRAAQNGELKTTYAPGKKFSGNYRFVQQLNDTINAVESPDALIPADKNGHTVMRYTQNDNSAMVAFDNKIYRTIVLGFPFETLETEAMRNDLMRQILEYLSH